ncbi:phage protein [Streptococcus dysgalactiae]|nr:phage protein [Streptococcus dysgalactiae]
MNKLELFLLAATIVLAVIARVQHEVIKKHNSPENKLRIFREVAMENSKGWNEKRSRGDVEKCLL